MIKVKVWENQEKEVYLWDKEVTPFFMIYRVVYLYKINKDNNDTKEMYCADCGEKAKFIVIDRGYNWAWCGHCNVGA